MSQMFVVITLRRPVDNREEGEENYEWVKQKLQPRPEIKTTGHVTNHFDTEE